MQKKNRGSVIIAETAFNHEGDKAYLLDLISSVSNTGVTHIKFQVLVDHDEFVSQLSGSYKLTKKWCFTEDEWEEIFSFAEARGLRLFLMPLDLKAIQLCDRDTVDYLEIHSVSFNDQYLLDGVFRSVENKVIVLGIGGRTVPELKLAQEKFKGKSLLFMHGFQAFPSKLEDVKLPRIRALQPIFPDCSFGFADHTAPDLDEAIYSSMYAYLLGASVFEKHVTLEKERTDSQSALQPAQMARFVSEFRRFEKIVDISEESALELSESELVYRKRQKQVVAIRPISIGDELNKENMGLKMHTEEGNFTRLDDVCGKRADKGYLPGELI